MALCEELLTTMGDSSRRGMRLSNRLYRGLRYKQKTPDFSGALHIRGIMLFVLK